MTSTTNNRVLIVTLYPESGGVPVLTRFAIKVLRAHGYEPVLAHYEPYRISPHMSVSVRDQFSDKKPQVEKREKLDGCETWAIGCVRPEFEYQHYRLSDRWQRVIDSCNRHICISGNILAATCLLEAGKNFVAWIATDWDGDRADRFRLFSLPRKILDVSLNRYPLRKLERRLLNAAILLPLSENTRRVLGQKRGREVTADVLPMPIDSDFFTVNEASRESKSIGFSGRYNDPRKDIGLFLRTVAQLKITHPDVRAYLIGETPEAFVTDLISELDIVDEVILMPRLSLPELRDAMQRLRVFMIPSTQEGLCISALEAMACGAPVVSTRCGGPEQFVIDGKTGFLIDSDPECFARKIGELFDDSALYDDMSVQARQEVETRYTGSACEAIFMNAFRQLETRAA